MDALALAVASAVIQYLVDKADLTKQVRGWLKRAPASLAYQRALLRAYAAFARSDPVLAQLFFSETLLVGAAVPELAKQLTRHEHANTAELARLWAATLYEDALAEQRAQWATNERVTYACVNFLQWLENELKREQVFQPLFDSRALDALEAKVDELTRALTAQRDEAMQRAEQYRPDVEQTTKTGGVNIAGSAHVHVGGDIVGGNKNIYNYHYYGDFATLDDLYVSPAQVFERVKVDEFAGREWLVKRIDAFLDDDARTSGVFVLEGVAGVGKTAFLAHLVRERGYLHLFAEQFPGDSNVKRALHSLGAQIVSRYKLARYADRDTLPEIAGTADFLFKLLYMASQQLTGGERVVVVCDALDEAGTGTNGNVFGLPIILPDNVYLILSQRPVSANMRFDCDVIVEELHPADSANLEDMKQYLDLISCRDSISSQLVLARVAQQDFTRILGEKSEGNWMYLHYAIREIEQGRRSPLDLARFPRGLVGYYLEYWQKWKSANSQRWNIAYLPILGTLAAIQEPATLDQLVMWSGAKIEIFELEELLGDKWNAFIDFGDKTPATYKFYHASLREFVSGVALLNDQPQGTRYRLKEFTAATRQAHSKIADYFLQRWGDDISQLDWMKIHDVEGGYGFRNIFHHLLGAKRLADAEKLLSTETNDEQNFWYQTKDAAGDLISFIVDLGLMWNASRNNVTWKGFVQQYRYALIHASLTSQSGNMPPALLSALVTARIWFPIRALASASLIQNTDQRTKVIMDIVEFLCRQGKPKEASSAIRELPDENSMLKAVQTMSELMASDLIPIVNEFQKEENKLSALEAIIPHSKTESRQDILKIIQSFGQDKNIGSALTLSYEYLLPDAAQGVLELIGKISNTSEQVTVYRTIGSFLSQELLSLALETARSEKDWVDYTQIAIAIIPFLQGTLKSQLQIETLVRCKVSGASYIVSSLSIADFARTFPPGSRQYIFLRVFGDITEFINHTSYDLSNLIGHKLA